MKKRLIIAVAALAMVGPYALAAGTPATVGELLDSGGKQLTGSEIRQLFTGATIGGPALGGFDARFQVHYQPNGTASGEVSSSTGSDKLTGTWSANQNNQYCQDLHTAQGMAIPGCFYYFTLGNRLFMAAGKDRSAQISERQVRR